MKTQVNTLCVLGPTLGVRDPHNRMTVGAEPLEPLDLDPIVDEVGPRHDPPYQPPETSMRDLRNHYHPKTYTPGKHTYRCARSAKGRVSDPMCH